MLVQAKNNSQIYIYRIYSHSELGGYDVQIKNSKGGIIDPTKDPLRSFGNSKVDPMNNVGINQRERIGIGSLQERSFSLRLNDYYDLPIGKYSIIVKAKFSNYVISEKEKYVEAEVISKPTTFFIIK